MKIAIVGYGVEGKAAYEYWDKAGNEITIHDQNETVELPEGAKAKLGKDYLNKLSTYDLIVRSPSVHPSDIAAANSEAILDKVTTNTDEFFRVCPTKNIIGITGTKGKGTTSTLTAKMLEACGKRVHLGGNIGIAPLEMFKQDIKPGDWVVLELSNFQLIGIKHSPHIGVCLMVVPEHLDWHPSVEEYVKAKQQLFRWQTEQDIAIFYGENDYSQEIVSVSKGQKIPYMQPPGACIQDERIVIDGQTICRTDELKLLGRHNWQNACAAVTAVWEVSQDAKALRSVLTRFPGLPHRLEFVRELDGVKYYDDSFGTTPETAKVAIQAFEQPKVLILGGSDKGATYGELAKVVLNNGVRTAVLIGLMAPKIQAALAEVGFTNFVAGGKTMNDIVTVARAQAQPGDVVLLSTACASYDMFKSYKDRGEQFKKAVLALS
ncbi:MAG TPA: UDP-N-acetylmuramoyl-L-alanine--D-glutamate ligase [Candidatus Saccharimonadales bacterium]|nr:UDP-N-acetylmuramoyl-L-alanine--D-glutamate ligase [Candidatus Saccharimonadales bacterium]